MVIVHERFEWTTTGYTCLLKTRCIEYIMNLPEVISLLGLFYGFIYFGRHKTNGYLVFARDNQTEELV